jgi:hypothetical protein
MKTRQTRNRMARLRWEYSRIAPSHDIHMRTAASNGGAAVEPGFVPRDQHRDEAMRELHGWEDD